MFGLNIKEVLGSVAVVIALIGYVPYLRDILADKTKPHAFSWFVWGILTLIGLLGQLSDNAGPGAWPTIVTTVLCVIIFGFALKKGKKNITKSDVVTLIAALIATLLWYITKEPTLSIILVTIADFLGFIPTIRKSWFFPLEETMSTYVLAGFKHALSILALTNYTLVTTLYPAYLVLANIFFVSMLIYRRRHYEESHSL